MIHLPRKTPAGETENDEHQRDRREDSRDAAQPTLEPADSRRQDEREQHGKRDGYEHGLRPVEDDNDKDTAGERHPGFQGARRVIHEPSPFHCMSQGHLGLFTLEQPDLIKGPTLGPMGPFGTIVSLPVPLQRVNDHTES